MSNENENPPPSMPPAPGQEGYNAPPQQCQPQMPSYYQQPAQPQGTFDNLIPTKNPSALIAYYLGVFSIVCGILAPFALGLGIKGLNDIKKQPGLPGKAHAMVGIIAGAIFTLLYAVLFVIIVLAFVNRPHYQ